MLRLKGGWLMQKGSRKRKEEKGKGKEETKTERKER